MNAKRFDELAKAARDAEDRSEAARVALANAEKAARDARAASDAASRDFHAFVAEASGIRGDEFKRWSSLASLDLTHSKIEAI